MLNKRVIDSEQQKERERPTDRQKERHTQIREAAVENAYLALFQVNSK